MKRTYDLDEAREIAENLEVDFATSAFGLAEFQAGLDVEAEHGAADAATNVTNDDPLTTGKIALAHLKELPDYYARLSEMEAKAEAVNAPEPAANAPEGGRKGRLVAGLLIGVALLAGAVVAAGILRRGRARRCSSG